jgi:catechol-2,3-dioxygenase
MAEDRTSPRYDRSSEDLGNVVALEHVNLSVADQRNAVLFYISALGLTRDPYLTTGVENMWVNIGQSQFHLPVGTPQVLRGHVGLVLPDRAALLRRLAAVADDLAATRYGFSEHDDHVEVISPSGNVLRCYAPQERFGPITLGLAYVEFAVPTGTAGRIARFYSEILGAPSTVTVDPSGHSCARCRVGHRQELIFRDCEQPVGDYDGHHIQIYLLDFSGPYAALSQRGLISEESNQWQYRFVDIVDVESNETLYTLEHEVRAMTHPLFGRPLVNRNAALNGRNFAIGHEDWPWTALSGT